MFRNRYDVSFAIVRAHCFTYVQSGQKNKKLIRAQRVCNLATYFRGVIPSLRKPYK